MKTILFVCTANMCRSPMAEGLMQRKLEREGRVDEFRAASAGVWTVNGRPATQSAILTMAEMGVDIHQHRSRVITEEIMDEAALILVMTQHHGEALRAEFPRVRAASTCSLRWSGVIMTSRTRSAARCWTMRKRL